MINANKETLQSFFQGTLQYEVPFFQRAYVWTSENWITFWDHLMSELEYYKNGKQSEHFIGTIITKQKDSQRIDENIVELIDGQQRLTTVSVLLKAIADTVKGDLPNLKNIINNLLFFSDSYNVKHYRMKHSCIDEPNFKLVMENEQNIDMEEKSTSAIIEGYKFFKLKLADFTDEDRDELRMVLLNKITVISMLLGHNDDEQEIFDTINSLGVKLTIGELLKNHVFKNPKLRLLYDDYWKSIFESEEQQLEYWRTEKTSGRVKRDNMEILLYSFLIIEAKKEIRLEKLFKEYKSYFKELDIEGKKEFLLRLKNMAEVYYQWPQEEQLVEINFNEKEKRFFHVLENLEITTIYPLVLYLFQRVKNIEERLKILEILESYVVMRHICKLTTKNYNNLFIQIIKQLDKIDSIACNDIVNIINSFKEDSNRIPTESEIKQAFKEVQLPNKQAGEILFLIALKDISSNYTDIKKLSYKSFSVEHIMPKKWEENWGGTNFNDLEKYKRNQKLRTLGNLTLITKNLNSKLRNQSWKNKRETLSKYSALQITTSYLNLDDWNEKTISERAINLAEKAINIWKI